MNNSGCILVQADNCDNGVWLYTHNEGKRIPIIIRNALRYGQYWDDAPYFTGLMFDWMDEWDHGHCGISTLHLDMNDIIYIINLETHTVELKDHKWWTFEEFIKEKI